MKSHLFVIVLFETGALQLKSRIDELLAPYAFSLQKDKESGRYDYLCELQSTLNDPLTEQKLPKQIRNQFIGHITEISRLEKINLPSSLITPDGRWHDLDEFGWKMLASDQDNQTAITKWQQHCWDLIQTYQHGWIVETWAHS